MARVPTSKDVARIAGVSQSTVSYVMSGKRPISEKTRRLVEDAMDQLTYQPHAGARALASQRTNIIALVMPFHTELSAHGLMSFAEQIALSARLRDHDVLLVTADEGPAGLQRVAGRALCDAVVLMEVRTHDERAQLAASLNMPTLFIGLPQVATGPGSTLHCIDFDFEGAAELLVGELADAGGEEVAVVGWGPDADARDINYVPRFRGAAERTAARRGVRLRWLAPEPGAGAVEAALAEVLDGPGAPPGLVLASSVPESVNTLLRRGLRPGVDLDVVALNTHAEAEAFPAPLTAVSPQPRDVSRQAMDWLFQLLDDPQAPGEVRLVPATITRRASVRPAPVRPAPVRPA